MSKKKRRRTCGVTRKKGIRREEGMMEKREGFRGLRERSKKRSGKEREKKRHKNNARD